MKPGTRNQFTLSPNQTFQNFDGNEEIDVFFEKGQWKIITPKRVLILQAEQVRKTNCSHTQSKKVSGVG